MNHPYPALKIKYNHLLGRFIDIFRDCRKREDELKDLVLHCWVHSGYENCGYREMTTKQKNVYDLVLKENERELDEE